MDEAQRASLVEPGSTSDQFRFVHALVREAIEPGLGRPYLVHLHRLAADAITQQYANPIGPHLFDLAHHSAEGAVEDGPVAAARWSERAAEQALRQLGYEAAARLFAQALRVGGAALEDEHRIRLLLAQAAALNLAGDLGGRLRNALEAAEHARRLQRPDLIAQAALVMEATGLPGFDIVSRRLCQEALTGLDDDNATVRARTAARFAETFIYRADTEAAEQASRHALELAEASGDPLALAAALRARQIVCAGPDGLEVRAHLAERMLNLSQRTADPKMESRHAAGGLLSGSSKVTWGQSPRNSTRCMRVPRNLVVRLLASPYSIAELHWRKRKVGLRTLSD